MVASKETRHLYKYDWDTVTTAFWNKYPNPNLPHVESSDVVSRSIDKDGNLRTARVARCRQDVPRFAQSFFGKYCFVYEETIVDPKVKTLNLKTVNISYGNAFRVEEHCSYKQHPDNKEWTEYKQEARITAFVPFISKKLEQVSVELSGVNASKGLNTMESICKDIFEGKFKNAYALCESDKSKNQSH